MKPNVSSFAGSQNFASEESRWAKLSVSGEASGVTCSFQGVASEPRQETNWEKFQKFLKEYLGAILELEQQNQSGIHLFAHNGKWLAFDRSARRLSRFFPDEDLTQLTLPADFQKKAPTTNPAAAKLPDRTVMLPLTEQQAARLKNFKTPAMLKHYYISSAVKALETDFKCPDDLSSDYKKEISEARVED